MNEWLLINVGIIILLVLIILYYYSQLRRIKQQLQEMTFTYKSATVKHGQHWEQFVPFMSEFEKVAQKENFVFIGMPIDGISFDDDAIKFIEVKTGKSQLNKKQQQVKRLIGEKQVEWIELRF